ncbi:unnamed protein product [Durusdinium trenchii]|uniref:Uncharacterized protein n=1 Tax=Durusdinium trenchii TaxID=1381693 RepID=A0ABP0LTE7_9DINO
MGPQRSGAIVLEVTCVPVQRSNGDLSIPRDGLVNDSSAPQDGTEIRLAQQLGGTLRSPEWGLSEQNGKVVIQKVGLRRWILTDDGLLILENRPEFALSVAGPIDAGAQLGLQFHYFTPDHKNSWQMDPSGRISLRHTPSFSLAVYNGALHGGAEVVLWNDPLSMPHNTWTRQAPTSGSLSSTDACKLRVLGSRCGRDSGSWFSGPKDYQKGYVAVSQSPDRDAATESSWAKVVDHSHSSEIAHFIKEPKMGSAFLLKLMDPTGKTVQGYLSCEEVGKDDKRIPDGVFAYVVKDPAGASMFEEEMSSEGLVLSHVGGGGHLCCGKFNEKDYVTGCTWLYVLKGQPEWAAAFAPQSTYVPAAGKKESCWKSFWKLYCLKWIPQWYRRWILLGCFLLGLFVIFWTIVWFVRLFQAPPEPLQINVPYDCDHQPEHMWSHTKKAWCCEHWDQGCPTTTVKPTPAAPKFPMAPGAAPTAPGVGGPPGGPVVSRAQSSDEDCFTDVLNWQRDWTISKQNFCCEKHGIACRAALTTAAFDCDEDYHKWTELWSYRKKLYCCLHHERGCPAKGEAEMGSSESFDCAAGYGDWEAWEQKKKEWCCYHASVACPGTPSQKYDCAQNYENWMHDWSEGKKVWCCFHNGRGCRDSNSQGYDCDAGVQNWQVGWSNSKMDYCCQTRGPEHFNLLQQDRFVVNMLLMMIQVVDVASIAAHALAQAATEEALEKSLSPQEAPSRRRARTELESYYLGTTLSWSHAPSISTIPYPLKPGRSESISSTSPSFFPAAPPMEWLRRTAQRWVSKSMEKDGSLFISHVNIIPKMAECDCLALQLPNDPKQLALAAHSLGALGQSKISCVFFSELPSSQAAELAFGLGEETQVVTVDEDIDWKVLFEGVGAPNCRAPVVVANLPVALAAEGVKQLQELGHSVLYAGATEEEVRREVLVCGARWPLSPSPPSPQPSSSAAVRQCKRQLMWFFSATSLEA